MDSSDLSGYLTQCSHGTPPSLQLSGTLWDRLQVVASINTVIIRVTLYLVWSEYPKTFSRPGPIVKNHVYTIMELLKLASQISYIPSTDSNNLNWIIVKAFLWSSWQRVSMLYYWNLLGHQLRQGYNFSENKFLAIQGLASIPDLFTEHNLQQLERAKKTPYMCRWAYELLRNDRSCVSMDLRRFHECYNRLFRDRPARCMDGHQQCDGRSSEGCRRFAGTETRNQSAHDWKCQEKCQRLFWDRKSFIGVVGPKAVCVESTDDNKLRYCTASKQTLAISHVWSHGQGGRPDYDQEGHHDQVGVPTATGFNSCLHHRYAGVAKFLGCDSYWMDTPCIPEEEPLRSECINNINWIFTNSKVTLVCDRDLMNIDVSALTMELRESILAVLLVCDWNVRAWTLLEAMRGRNNIHLLCKRNQVICFKELLTTVHQEGRTDIASLFLTSQHLMPHVPPPPDGFSPNMFYVPEEEEDKMKQMGFVSVAEGGTLLGHRHASRRGDDILIWSLLVHEKATKNVVQLWKSQLGKMISTGYLLSSAPRIQGRQGLSWAPCSPTLQSPPNAELTGESIYFPYDESDALGGHMTLEGLQAEWFVHKFSTSKSVGDESTNDMGNTTSIIPRIIGISARYLEGYQRGALLRPCAANGPRRVPPQYRGNAREPLLAVCGSSDERRWEWRGVYEWNSDVILPEFEIEYLLLI